MASYPSCESGRIFSLSQYDDFVLPPAVGIMDKFDVIQPYLLPIVLIILGAIIINVTLIAFSRWFYQDKV